MVNMKLSDEERAEYPSSEMAPQPLYPWGLSISLDDDALEKLGLELPAVDQILEFRIKAQVTGISSNKMSNDDNEECARLQITDMECVKESGRASKLYRSK